ncbi:hypothetical protein LG272_11000 [Pseudidiomarina marina]|uniref:hypothetical protein n=1 Tax=Pseudidiomarina marina TaxID=502366 RepID=UPI00384AA2C4
MKISRKQAIYIVTVLLALLLGFALAVWLHDSGQVDITSFTVAVLSGVISLVALFIALQTYISIDSVNNITKMEGNILDNEHYVTSMPEFIETYPQTTEASLRSAIISEMQTKLAQQSNTGVDFADTLQSMIDILVLFPAMNANSDEAAKASIATMITDMKTKAADFQSISKGNSIQIQQAAKLFEAVCEYQGLIVHNKTASTGLLKVRGPVLRNPVSVTVYYNYLGLHYRRLAVGLFGNKDELDVASLKKGIAATRALSAYEMEKLKRYVALADESFERALSHSQDDPMWRGYILFNQARLYFARAVTLGEKYDFALDYMKRAIDARTTLNELIRDVVSSDSELSILQKHYLFQEEYARQLYVSYCLAVGRDASYRGQKVTLGADYEALVADKVAVLCDVDRKKLAAMRAE